MLSRVSCRCFLSSLDLKGLLRSRFFFAMIFEGDSSFEEAIDPVIACYFVVNSVV